MSFYLEKRPNLHDVIFHVKSRDIFDLYCPSTNFEVCRTNAVLNPCKTIGKTPIFQLWVVLGKCQNTDIVILTMVVEDKIRSQSY